MVNIGNRATHARKFLNIFIDDSQIIFARAGFYLKKTIKTGFAIGDIMEKKNYKKKLI